MNRGSKLSSYIHSKSNKHDKRWSVLHLHRSTGVPPISPCQRDVTSDSLFRTSTVYVNLNRRLEGTEIVIPAFLGVLDSQSERHVCLICGWNVEKREVLGPHCEHARYTLETIMRRM
jgi:hypothetical protein